MKRFAIDTGPLVAFLNGRDGHHEWAVQTLDTITAPLHTCEAVISETCFLLRDLAGGADRVLAMLERGVIRVGFRLDSEVVAVGRLMARYADVPMSLADACLVRMTELDAKLSVVTLDTDFRTYRRNGRQVVPLVTLR